MALTKDERELFEEKFRGIISLMNAQFDNVNDKLERIEGQTIKTNGRVTVLEHKEDRHTIDCPHTLKIRTLEDNQLTQKSIKKWIVGSVTITGTIMGILFILFKVFISQ